MDGAMDELAEAVCNDACNQGKCEQCMPCVEGDDCSNKLQNWCQNECIDCLACHVGLRTDNEEMVTMGLCWDSCDQGWCYENCEACLTEGPDSENCHEDCEANCSDCAECHMAMDPCMEACDMGW